MTHINNEKKLGASHKNVLIKESLKVFEEDWNIMKDDIIIEIRKKNPNSTEKDVKNSIIDSIKKGKLLIDYKNKVVYTGG